MKNYIALICFTLMTIVGNAQYDSIPLFVNSSPSTVVYAHGDVSYQNSWMPIKSVQGDSVVIMIDISQTPYFGFQPQNSVDIKMYVDSTSFNGIETQTTIAAWSSDTITIAIPDDGLFHLLTITQGQYRLGIKIKYDPISSGIYSNGATKSILSVFPNPAVERVNVQFNTKEDHEPVRLYDMEGRLVYEDDELRDHGQNTVTIIMDIYSDGVYFVTVGSDTFKVLHVSKQ